MACDLSKGRLEPCKDSVGGIKALYFINYSEKAYAELDPTADDIIDLSTDPDVPTAVTVYQWDVKMATNLEETINSSRETGTTFWEQALNATFKKLDAETRQELIAMAHGRPQIIIHDYNGNALLVGEKNGCDCTGGTVVTGAAMGDLSGYTMVMTGQERVSARFLQGSTIDDPFAGLTTAPTIVDGSTP